MSLTIGKLARRANVNVETIRYYQRLGLLQEPAKPRDGYRVYPDSYVERLHFVKRAQKLGFTLKEIAELLSLGDGHCDDVRTLAEHKRGQIDEQMQDLLAMRKVLDELIDCCRHNRVTEHCSIIEALTGEAGSNY